MTASVIMSIFNGEKYLLESMTSVLGQSFSNFEFIIIDDGSTDQSADIVKKFEDPRIRFFSNKKNCGLPYSLNRGIKHAKGQYLFRMDQDDISFPERFKTQIAFMENYKDIDICGTAVYSEKNGKKLVSSPLTNPEEIKATLLFRNVLAHPSVIMRKSSLVKHNLFYDPKLKNAEDYDLWTRSFRQLKMTNISTPLIFYRKHESQMINMSNLRPTVAVSRTKFLANFIPNPSKSEQEIHTRISTGELHVSWQEVNTAEKWLERLVLANKKRGLVDNQAMMNVISSQWLTICLKSSKLGSEIITKYLHSSLAPKSLHKWKYTALLTYKVFKP